MITLNDLDTPFHDDESPLPFKLITLKPPPMVGEPEPFDLSDDPEVVELDSHDLPVIVATPAGDEVVLPEVFEEETKVYNQVELAALLADACPHRHTTLRSMHAVRPIV